MGMMPNPTENLNPGRWIELININFVPMRIACVIPHVRTNREKIARSRLLLWFN